MNNPENLNLPVLDKDKNVPLTFWQSLRHNLFNDPFSNLPSFFLLGVGLLGITTLVSSFFVDFLNFPFAIVATLASFFAMWHIRMLGSLKQQIDRLSDENTKLATENHKFGENNQDFSKKIDQFSHENETLSGNLFEMELTIDTLKINNDRLHMELGSLKELRQNLQEYADDTQIDFAQLLGQVNQSFERLEVITIENERALLHRIAQDLEFLDHEPGMKKDEYDRFVERIPAHLHDAFANVGTSFETLSGEDDMVDYKEIRALVHSAMKDVKILN